ncbi:MAG: hypothetical protein A3J65_00160 [Candidatus Buchananbacteria bacterium RIFCSPHIGHO2_02_FULL_45_11b]|uniref:Uncharacterized protein n=3 Tax=Candidatus Buchananiibacteriota TaxID=1817903 RepID=A0A1G1YDC3_9BACT|nr:MAG: hypothetical protein A2663_00165 [Candidatus Buchananbacteria bacterium RIFCSPHIGHO2_01_FULL_46_12]OGY50343.1 MAG: hypothetical protein A3J65_00160 [Candidatus Buchananbacteria bacterium RIFCSPHIGHO2_02_FULL_45_11b]OGY57476.1 MAG: hypothetical protein A3H67_02390 [Candidatus Buchananbacteria bacterium RIFCSPLOWO2_02_FULL_46_11b]
MAEPAKKLPPPPAEAEIELTLIKKPADKKDNIIDFNQYRRDLNKGKAADKKELEKENTPEPQTEAGKKHKENVTGKPAGAKTDKELDQPEIGRQELENELEKENNPKPQTEAGKEHQENVSKTPAGSKNKEVKAPESPEQQKARQAKQGAEMEGVSESAGLTGGIKGEGEETKPSAAAKQQKTPAPAGGQPPESPSHPEAPSGEEGGGEGEEEPEKPKSTFQQTQQKIDAQKKKVSGSEDKAAKAKEKAEKDKEQKSWKRALSGHKAKKAQKEAAKEKKKLAGLEKALGTQMASGKILKQSWINLIDSWGLTYFYIAFHFLAAYFTPFSNFFCKFGEEWLPQQAKAKGGEAAKQASKGLELVESCGCVLIGLALFFAIMGVLVLFATLGYAYEHKLETLYQLGPGIAWEAIKVVGGWIFGAQ